MPELHPTIEAYFDAMDHKQEAEYLSAMQSEFLEDGLSRRTE